MRDNELQDKIREYTNKLLQKRENRNENPKIDKWQAARDIKELKILEKELEQRRMELTYGTTNKIKYRETAKLNSKATVANILKTTKRLN